MEAARGACLQDAISIESVVYICELLPDIHETLEAEDNKPKVWYENGTVLVFEVAS